MGSLAGFAHQLLVEFDEPSKWGVQETGKAPEPPNSKNWVWARHISAVSALLNSASFLPTLPPTPKPPFPF